MDDVWSVCEPYPSGGPNPVPRAGVEEAGTACPQSSHVVEGGFA